MTRADLEDFVQCFKPGALNDREESERFKRFSYEELLQRDKTNLDIFWLKDDSIVDPNDLPEPQIIAEEIQNSLEAALAEIAKLLSQLRDPKS